MKRSLFYGFDDGYNDMMRRYGSSWSRFSQPDPYDGSYDFSDPQSFNRYAYVQNDPVNFVDPSGLNMLPVDGPPPEPKVDGGFMSPGIHTTSFFGWYEGIERPVYGLINFTFFNGGVFGSGGAGRGVAPGHEAGHAPLNPNNGQETKPTNQRVEACVATVLARYLGREALTLLKQAALNAGIGLSVLAGRFFIGHAIGGTIAGATLAEIGIAVGIRLDHLSRGMAFVGGAIWAGAKLYPKLVRESFNNKKEAVSALKACYD